MTFDRKLPRFYIFLSICSLCTLPSLASTSGPGRSQSNILRNLCDALFSAFSTETPVVFIPKYKIQRADVADSRLSMQASSRFRRKLVHRYPNLEPGIWNYIHQKSFDKKYAIESTRLLLEEYQKVDWAEVQGQQIDINLLLGHGHHVITQLVLSPSDYSTAVTEAVQQILDLPHSRMSIDNGFKETGIFVLQFWAGALISAPIVGDFDQIDQVKAGKELRRVLRHFVSILEEFEASTHSIDVSMIHTHPGKGTALSPTDIESNIKTSEHFKKLLDGSEGVSGDRVTTRIIAVPVENEGELLFEHVMSVYRD